MIGTTEMLAILAAVQGTICLIAWPLFPNRRSMLWCQFGIAAGFTLHYALTGIQTAALLNGLSGLQVLASLAWGESRRSRWIVWGSIPAIGLACALTWSGLPSILSTAGMMLVALGRTQNDPARLRGFVVAGIPFWLSHDLLVGSPLFIADAISGAIGLWAIFRLRQKQDVPQQTTNVVRLPMRTTPHGPSARHPA
jgi:hypothetical protein